jgi:hypothetical protein
MAGKAAVVLDVLVLVTVVVGVDVLFFRHHVWSGCIHPERRLRLLGGARGATEW